MISPHSPRARVPLATRRTREEQRNRDVAEYGELFRATVLEEAERRYPGLKVEVRVLAEDEPD